MATKPPTLRVRKMTADEFVEQQQRKADVVAQSVDDLRFETRPTGKAPTIEMSPLMAFPRRRVMELAKMHRVNVYSRPSHAQDS